MSAQILTVKYNENNVPYIGLGAHEIRLESEQPTEAVMEKARVELRELDEITGPAISELREMLKGEQQATNKKGLEIPKFVSSMTTIAIFRERKKPSHNNKISDAVTFYPD